MNIYIRGAGMISPQVTYKSDQFLDDIKEYNENYLPVIDPGYKNFIDPKQTRRMSKVIKMGVAAAKICLDDAGISMPGAILAGTGLGCIEDTENFLSDIINNKEQLLTPTPFIQSTHNTVAAQIALIIKCHELNFTYVHRGFSFELALFDALLHIKEQTADNILVGGIDELTPNTFTILKRLGLIKRNPVNNLSLISENGKGTVYGEGAGFFLLTSLQDANNYAKLSVLKMLIKPESKEEVESFIRNVISEANLTVNDISLVIGGMNGDERDNKPYRYLQDGLLKQLPWAGFKHLCGEYHTASAFAFWLASKILKEQHIPPSVIINNPDIKEIKNILIYNHFAGINHVACILQTC